MGRRIDGKTSLKEGLKALFKEIIVLLYSYGLPKEETVDNLFEKYKLKDS